MAQSSLSTPPQPAPDLSKEDDASVIELAQGHQAAQRFPSVPSLFTALPILRDHLQTETSIVQEETVQDCLPFLEGVEGGPHKLNSFGLPKLDRDAHSEFLHSTLGKYPSAYIAFDASRPWCIYWALTGLCLLGEDVSEYRQRVIQTLSAAQNATGGFGGGHGQASHIAPTYAAVLCLAMVGSQEAYDLIDRRAMWEWMGTIKDSDGGFRVAVDAELDARGAYCAMVVMALLNLPLELPPTASVRGAGLASFLDGLPRWLAQCQTYEGGMAAIPGSEAHAAYTYCVIACLNILDEPTKCLEQRLDIPLLMSWLSSRQYAPEGGLSGRTNKLVDACYSHWAGGCWPLINAALAQNGMNKVPLNSLSGLWSKEGLARYILCCAQNEGGGMRDKPFKTSDGYHTCYALAGLSSIQNRSYFSCSLTEQPLGAAFGWAASRYDWEAEEGSLFDAADILEPLHPVFMIPFDAAEEMRKWATMKIGF